MQSEFLDWDDQTQIVNNPVINQGLSLETIWQALQTISLNLWSPLALWSHQLDVSLFGMNPDAHHLMGMGYHILAGIALWWALRKALEIRQPVSLLVTGLFLLHPAQVESWAWISERKDVLAALFGFLSLGAWGKFLKTHSRNWSIATIVFLLLSLMAKPALVFWPVILLAMSLLFEKREEKTNKLGHSPFAICVSCLLCGAIILITLSTQNNRAEMGVMSQLDLSSRIFLGFANYSRYILRAFYPVDLSYFYTLPKSLPLTMGALGAFLVGGLLWLGWKKRKKRPVAIFGFLFFIIMLAPTCGFILSGESYGPDRYGYIAYVGLFLAIGSLLPDHFGRKRSTQIITISLLAGLGVLSFKQALTWRNMETLTSHALRLNPENYKAHAHRAAWLTRKGNQQEGLRHWTETYRIRPDHETAAVILGNQAMTTKKFSEAIELFATHQKHWPGQLNSKSGLAAALAQSGEYKKALQLYQELVKEYPGEADFQNNLETIQKARL